ncbi:MAG: substrate-binding periplasmic protein [Gulosibacter sp.]|uniref:substrate-binding periplasmic protein n=1 Tax=Gulosibacter sp. TaxID=2817531 RepID=UPI003F8F97D0
MGITPRTKNNRSRLLAVGSGLAAFTLMLTGCSAGGGGASSVADDCEPVAEVETMTEGKLTALVVEHPPFITTEGNTLSGVEGELLNHIAAQLCLEMDYQVTSFAGAIEGLQNNRADLSSSNWTVNDERRDLFEVSEPMYQSTMGIVTKGEDWNTVEDLADKKIGTPQGYLWNEQLYDVFGDNVTEYQSDVAVIDDIKAGRIDVGIVNNHANSWRLTQDQYSELSLTTMEPSDQLPHTQQEALAVVLVEKGNVELKDGVNIALTDFIDSGEFQSQFEAYGLDPQWIYSPEG